MQARQPMHRVLSWIIALLFAVDAGAVMPGSSF
jgi:hypothetical protein